MSDCDLKGNLPGSSKSLLMRRSGYPINIAMGPMIIFLFEWSCNSACTIFKEVICKEKHQGFYKFLPDVEIELQQFQYMPNAFILDSKTFLFGAVMDA